MATLTPQRRVLATAAAEIGYSRWKDDKKGTKYARETQPVFWPRDTWLLANGISFCDLFVTWVFWKALGEDFVTDGGLPAGASYNTDYRASKGGRVRKPPRPGDVLVFDWNWATLSTNHVGILEKVLPSGNYQTIEGNTSPGSSGSQGNGGGVYRRTRRPDQVRYVIRPNWSKASGPTAPAQAKSDPAKPWTTSPRVASMPAAEVRAIQSELVDAGYPVGSYGIDGSYGDGTGTAVKQLQTDLGLTADGVWGPTTQEALMTIRSELKALSKKIDAIPREVMHIQVPLEGDGWKGKSGNLTGIRKWYAADMAAIKRLIRESQAATIKAIQEAAKGQGLTDAQVEKIATAAAEASARVSAEDVADRLEVTARES